jgi:hypothetical protein
MLGTVLIVSLASGCAPTHEATDVSVRPMRVSDLAKSDIDEMTEIHLRQARDHLATLMRKLYRRNPVQWRAAGRPSAEFVVQRVFRPPRVPDFVELQGKRGVDAVRLAFDDSFTGDRVLALIAGLAAMLDTAYGNKREFFMLDSLDAQKLYNSARNLEIAAWQLRTRRGTSGQLLLLSHSLQGEEVNLSFERLFGKLISLQDTLALLVANRSNRTIRTVVQRMASAVFLPI